MIDTPKGQILAEIHPAEEGERRRDQGDETAPEQGHGWFLVTHKLVGIEEGFPATRFGRWKERLS
jgi:hypothetical protein